MMASLNWKSSTMFLQGSTFRCGAASQTGSEQKMERQEPGYCSWDRPCPEGPLPAGSSTSHIGRPPLSPTIRLEQPASYLGMAEPSFRMDTQGAPYLLAENINLKCYVLVNLQIYTFVTITANKNN